MNKEELFDIIWERIVDWDQEHDTTEDLTNNILEDMEEIGLEFE